MPSALYGLALAAALSLLPLQTLPAAAAAQDAAPSVFYVALDGDDGWSGRLPAPNAAKTDGPFATLKRAQQAVRPLLGQKSAATVFVRGGFYPLTEPLVFDRSDGGAAPTLPAVYAAFRGETPVLSGGTRITGWRRTAPGGRWEVTLPAVARGEWRFSQLYVNGERRLRPRLPKRGYYYVGGSLPPTPQSVGKGYDRFHYRAGDIDPDWRNRDDVDVLLLQIWSMSRFPIADVEPTGRVLTLAGHTRGQAYNWSLPHGTRYLVENVPEALSEPGEWYLDRKTGVLTYLARPGEDPNRDMVIAPRLERLLEVNGTANLVLRGLTFADAAWNLGPGGLKNGQAEIGIPAALQLTGARDCVLENCTVRNIGNYAVGFGQGTRRCRLESCTLRDMGAGGVLLGEQRNPGDDAQRVSHNTIRDCLIAEGGRLHASGVGIWIGQSPHNLIEHNEIVDFYYTGISSGWTWGYNDNDSHHNRIAYNHIHRLGQGVLSDMGGIYTLGISPGTVLDHNRIHDVHAYNYGGWGIYFDEGSTGIVARNNVLYNTKSAPFMQHYGTKNLFENNILAFGREAQLMRARADNNKSTRPGGQPDMRAESSFTIRRNIVYGRNAPVLVGDWSGSNFTLAENLYWDADPKHPPYFPGNTALAQWQSQGRDAGSLVADPLFRAPERGDFTLRAGSPASKIGFTQIDVNTAGRRTGAPYVPNAPRTFPAPPSPRPWVADDFEDSAIGGRPSSLLAVVSEEGADPAGTVRISDETAATGKRSLKIADAAGRKSAAAPTFSYKLRLTYGVVTSSFALRIEPGAVITHEWRDGETPVNRGPSLRIAADGTLTANGRVLDKLPLQRWMNFTLSCALGSAATGTYDLTLRLPGSAPPRHYTGLNCDKGFRSLRWWGFLSEADAPGAFYLDDLSLTAP